MKALRTQVLVAFKEQPSDDIIEGFNMFLDPKEYLNTVLRSASFKENTSIFVVNVINRLITAQNEPTPNL